MKKLMLIGKRSAGKTSIIQRLKNEDLIYRKTQAMVFEKQYLDSPGEYLEMKGHMSALITSSYDYDVIGLVQAANDKDSLFPPGLQMVFNKKIIGIITKIDLPEDELHIPQVTTQLEIAGAEKIFYCSSVSMEGIRDIREYLLQDTSSA